MTIFTSLSFPLFHILVFIIDVPLLLPSHLSGHSFLLSPPQLFCRQYLHLSSCRPFTSSTSLTSSSPEDLSYLSFHYLRLSSFSHLFHLFSYFFLPFSLLPRVCKESIYIFLPVFLLNPFLIYYSMFLASGVIYSLDFFLFSPSNLERWYFLEFVHLYFSIIFPSSIHTSSLSLSSRALCFYLHTFAIYFSSSRRLVRTVLHVLCDLTVHL